MHRLAEKLIQDGKNDKAEILKLSLEKMPLDYFGFYSLVEPYISTYYKLGLYEEGNSLFNQLEEKYNQLKLLFQFRLCRKFWIFDLLFHW